MSLMSKIISFSRTSKGRQMTEKATRYASSPEGKRKIAQARERVASRGGGRGRISR